jgi:hypothetical protein
MTIDASAAEENIDDTCSVKKLLWRYHYNGEYKTTAFATGADCVTAQTDCLQRQMQKQTYIAAAEIYLCNDFNIEAFL